MSADTVFIFWATDGEHIRLWTKDRQRALQFTADSGLEAQVYVPAGKVTEAWQEATRQAMEQVLDILHDENGCCETGISFAIQRVRALADVAAQEPQP